MPRIIDFGVAKATSQELTPDTMFTRARLSSWDPRLHEPGASRLVPARISMPAPMSIRSGWCCMSCWSARCPSTSASWPTTRSCAGCASRMRRGPARKLSTGAGDSAITAKNRGTDPSALARQLRGDPDAIALKALEKDRKRRYSAASDLAADIGRYLNHQPVSAHAPRVGYRVRKFLRRNRVTVNYSVAGTVVTVALVIAAYLWSERQKTTPFAHFTIERATDSDHTSVAAISPDGSYLASVCRPKGENSLWVRQLATKSDHPILQQPSFQYLGLIFSPDGSYIYFWVNAIGDHILHHRRDVYRIPTAGGQPTSILQDVDMLPSFIDGGRRLCFERQIVDKMTKRSCTEC